MIVNNNVIQPKPAAFDDDTDRTMCRVFIELLQKVRCEHDALVELGFNMEEKFWSINKRLDDITPDFLNTIYSNGSKVSKVACELRMPV